MSWYFKKDLRVKGDKGWTKYKDEESELIEAAYQVFDPLCSVGLSVVQKKRKTCKLNAKYQIDFVNLIQYRHDDKQVTDFLVFHSSPLFPASTANQT